MKSHLSALLKRVALIATFSALVFANCLGPAQAALSRTSTAGRVGPPNGASAEILTGRHFRFHRDCPNQGPEPRPWSVSFSITGNATGTYPGTFVATGGWVFIANIFQWAFSESFTVTSGSSEVSGSISGQGSGFGPDSCSGFGPADLQYSTTGAQGKVDITIRRHDFRETFYGL
jgi:hypothetical protein